MNSLEEHIILAKVKIQENHDAFIKRKLSIEKLCLKSISHYNSQFKVTPFVKNIELSDIYNYYKLICGLKYLNYYKDQGASMLIYSMDINSIECVFEKIEDCPKVLLFDKYRALRLIDKFYDLRIRIDLLNRECGSVIARNKNGNWIFASISEAINFQDSGSDSGIYRDQLNRMSRNAFLKSLQEYLNSRLEEESKILELDTDRVKDEMIKLLSGEKRNLEKQLFPMLYGLIQLKEDFKDDKIIKEDFGWNSSPTKRKLLYDIFPIILPDREFKKRDANLTTYNGSHYRYRIDTVKSIIGM